MPPSIRDRLLGAFGRRSMPTIAFLHPGRVGSTVLGTMLGDREDTVWDAELFEPRRRARVPEIDAGMTPSEVIRARRNDVEESAYVFAVKYLRSLHLGVLDTDLDGLLAILDAAGVDHVVAIRRRNYLRRLVSGAVGRKRGSFHQHAKDGPVDLVTVVMDPAAVPLGPHKPLLAALEELESEERELAAALEGRQHLWVDFEDHIEQDPTVAYERVCGFAGLPVVDIDARLARTTDFPLAQVVENFDEVARVLEGTRFAWMLQG